MRPQNTRRLLPFFVAVATLLSVGIASAHVSLTSPPMRAGNGQKTNPCGGAAKGAATAFTGGEKVKFTFTETIDHEGEFFVSFDPTGDDFDGDGDGTGDYPGHPKLLTAKNGTGSLVLGSLVDTKNGPDGAMHELEVTLPNVSCDNCTLQLIQMMSNDSKIPTDGDPTNHIYFRCVDVKLTAVQGGAGGAGAGGASMGGASNGGAAAGGASNGGASTGGVSSGGASAGGASSGGAAMGGTGTGGTTTPPTGPMTPATGGVPSGAGGSGGSVTTPVDPPASDDGGCSVATTSKRSTTGAGAALLALFGLLWVSRRRS